MDAGGFHIAAAAPEAVFQPVIDGLDSFSASVHAPTYHEEHYALALRDSAQQVQGGLVGKFVWDWLNINYLWVAEGLRGQAFGQQLLHRAEHEARQRNCAGLFVWTQSWQAPGFYAKCGFTPAVTLPDFPKGHQRIGLVKKLSGQGA